jgi:hypothetical protein
MTSDAPCSGSPSGERHAAFLEQARYRGLSLVGMQKVRTDIQSRDCPTGANQQIQLTSIS